MPDNQLPNADFSDNRFESFGALPVKGNLRGQRPATGPRRSESLPSSPMIYANEPPDPDKQQFFELVLAQLDAGLLRYSKRLQLIKLAKQWSISEFEANLIIAHAQYHLGKGKALDLTIRTDQQRPRGSEKFFSILIRTGLIVLLALLLDWLLIRWVS